VVVVGGGAAKDGTLALVLAHGCKALDSSQKGSQEGIPANAYLSHIMFRRSLS